MRRVREIEGFHAELNDQRSVIRNSRKTPESELKRPGPRNIFYQEVPKRGSVIG